MKKVFADLHIHTCFSDGTFTPREVITEARRVGLSCIAIADHDSIEGISPALGVALQCYIEVIPAIEFSTEENDTEVHILGYFIDYKNKLFVDKLKILRKARRERMYKMVEKLNALNINITPEEICSLSPEGAVGRLHVAQVLLRKGYVKTITDAFKKYLGNDSPCYVGRFKLTPKEAIEIINKIGGISVIAHPYSMNNDLLIENLAKAGIGGIEAYYPEHSSRVTRKYLEIANEYGLLVTGGSDCHGMGRGKIALGSIKIPYELVEKMKAKLSRYNDA